MKLDVYAGILGAGKTTLIKQMLSSAYQGKKVAIIENEIGAVNLDAAELGSVTVKEITAGCVCCTLKGSFTEAIRMLEEQEHPDYIVVEPTGASDLRGLLKACLEVESVESGRCILVVNTKKIARFMKAVGEFFKEQIRIAKIVYLNFADIMEKEEVEEAKRSLLQINPQLLLIDTPLSEITEDTFPEVGCWIDTEKEQSSAKLLVKEAQDQAPKILPNKKQTQIYTWSHTIEGTWTEAQVQALTELLQDTKQNEIWRVKGYIPMTNGTVKKIDLVFEEAFLEEREASKTQNTGTLVVIGKHLDVNWLQDKLREIEEGQQRRR